MFLLRLMLHDQSGAALMRLAAEGIALHDAPLAPPPYERGADGACTPAALTGTLSTFKGRGAPVFPYSLKPSKSQIQSLSECIGLFCASHEHAATVDTHALGIC